MYGVWTKYVPAGDRADELYSLPVVFSVCYWNYCADRLSVWRRLHGPERRPVQGVLRRHVQDVGRDGGVYVMRQRDVLWHVECDNVERVHAMSAIHTVVCRKPGTRRLQVRFRVLYTKHVDTDYVVPAVLAGHIQQRTWRHGVLEVHGRTIRR